MTVEREGCGEQSPVGDEVIVGVEGAFTGLATDPDIDPAGLMMLLALIDNRYWPLHVCGDSGIGAAFNIEDNRSGNVITRIVEIDSVENAVEAHGCVLNCQYTITTDIQAECIIAEIDGKYQILRVRANSFTGDITGPDNSCRCCGITPDKIKMFARVISVDPVGCDGYAECDEFVIRSLEGSCAYDPENPLGIEVGCFSLEGSELNDPADWQVSVCGQAVQEILSVDCCMPIVGCDGSTSDSGSDSASTSGSESEQCRVEIRVRTGPLANCGGCDFELLIYSDPYDYELCAAEDVIIDEVDAEACGLPDLQVGDRVILAQVPFRFPGVSSGGECGPVEFYIIRACQTADCSYPCEPPVPPEAECCGVLCQDTSMSLNSILHRIDLDDSGYDIAGPVVLDIECCPDTTVSTDVQRPVSIINQRQQHHQAGRIDVRISCQTRERTFDTNDDFIADR